VIEWQDVCLMCGIVWLTTPNIVVHDNDVAKLLRQTSSASTRELWETVQHVNI
jgi:hypothetical protein